MSADLARPAWLLLLLLLPAWWFWVLPRGRWGLLVPRSQEAEPVSLARWLGATVEGAPRLLRATAVASLVVALAEPRLIRTYQEEVSEGVAVALAIDLSTSMWAQDMAEQTTRLEAAKTTVQRFLASRERDDVGLVSFAGEAHVRLPLTRDRYVAEAAVDELEVGLLLDGTDVAGAIAVGAGLLKDAPHRSKILILVTDGAHNKAGLAPELAARAAATFGVRIYPIAIGAEESMGGSQLGMETVLTQAALITGGRYYRATDVEALDRIYEEIDRLAVGTDQLVDRAEATPVGHWLLLLSLGFLVAAGALRASRWGVLP
ncbi:MAG TPA: VWA domain-containing protein [Longimicrobiales bacterium]|nr:VWA domain-containing protein [Longimicrobiales bacterium]